MATIITDVPVDFDEEKLKYAGPDAEKLKPIFKDLEFKAISARAFGEAQSRRALRPPPQGAQLSMFGQPDAESVEDTGERKKNFGPDPVQYKLIENVHQLEGLGYKT